MLRRIALIAIIAGAYASAMYTSTGCSPYETSSPTQPPTAFGALRGTVTDAQTGLPVSGVNVSAFNSARGEGVSLFTDNAGKYEIILAVGSIRVTATKSGYQTFTTTLDLGAIGITALDIKLQPNP